MASIRHLILDVVELRSDVGEWPAGTVGTVLETDGEWVLVEVSDESGRGLDFLTLPHDALAPSEQRVGGTAA